MHALSNLLWKGGPVQTGYQAFIANVIGIEANQEGSE